MNPLTDMGTQGIAKIHWVSLFLLLFAFPLSAELILPEKLYVSRVWIHSSLKFSIETDETSLGMVHRKLFSKSYEFVDHKDYLQSVAIWREDKFDILDDEGGLLGTLLESDSFFCPVFYILSPSKKKIAIAEANLWNTKIIISDPETSVLIAELHRPFFRSTEDWSATIMQDLIDPRIFISMLAIQSDASTIPHFKGQMRLPFYSQEKQLPHKDIFFAQNYISEFLLPYKTSDEIYAEIPRLIRASESEHFSDGERDAFESMIHYLYAI